MRTIAPRRYEIFSLAILALILLATSMLGVSVPPWGQSAAAAQSVKIAIGVRDASSSLRDWDEFTYSESADPTLDVRAPNLSKVRQWIGFSTCASCGTTNRKQFLSFKGLAVGAPQTVILYPSFASSAITYSVSVAEGQATISSGSSFSFPQVTAQGGFAAGQAPVTIRFTPQTSDVTLRIGNGATSGVHYLYFDQFTVEMTPAASGDLQPAPAPPPASASTTSGTADALITAVSVGGKIVPVYPNGNGTKIGFLISNGALEAYNENAEKLWSIPSSATDFSAGFDLNADDIVDVGLIVSVSTGRSCGTSVVYSRRIEVRSGKDGSNIASMGPLEDICWTNLNYASIRISNNSMQFGDAKGVLTVIPQYWSQGWFYRWNNHKVTTVPFISPLTASFDATYPTCTFPPGLSHCYVQDSQPQHGIVVGNKYVAFSSKRVSQYDTTQYSASQLKADYTFLARSDIAGRAYGVLSPDPKNQSWLALVGGTSVHSLYADMRAGAKVSDPWAGIERNFILYNTASNALQQRFYSYAHDNGNAAQYQGRIVHPAHVWLPSTGSLSHVAYNVYNESGDKHWYLHISKPGSTADAKKIPNVFLWDARDIDGDGKIELVTSPIESATGGEYYFPSWKTVISEWDPATLAFVEQQTVNGVIPYVALASMEKTAHDSSGKLGTIFTGNASGTLALYVNDSSNRTTLAPLGVQLATSSPSAPPPPSDPIPPPLPPPPPPTAEQKKFSLGVLEKTGGSSDWNEFTSTADIATVVVGQGSESSVRQWIGFSTCPACGTTAKKQRFALSNLIKGEKYTIKIYAAYSSSATPVAARVVDGAGTIASGASTSFAVGSLNGSLWTITFVADSSTATIEVGNSASSGTHYVYLDAIEISGMFANN